MLRAGKLPQNVLEGLLAGIPASLDPRVLLGPAIGRDAAVIDIGGGRVLVATTDPVTFAAEDIGWYAVHVNANDIACLGARPSWFLATILLPAGAADDLPAQILNQLVRAASELDITIAGGHTEVSAGIERPIVIGTMLGECAREDLVNGDGIEAGDAVILIGDIAIEGTALLAREAPDALRSAGVASDVIASASSMLFEPGISVVGAAQALCEAARPRLMHDPTEGGIATALHEMAAAAHATLRIDLAAISALSETLAVCDALGLDRLGLLASGALLAILPEEAAASLANDRGLPGVRIIGEVEQGPGRVILEAEDQPLPMFERDELARFFDSTAGE